MQNEYEAVFIFIRGDTDRGGSLTSLGWGDSWFGESFFSRFKAELMTDGIFESVEHARSAMV